jgi:hypothetical protein
MRNFVQNWVRGISVVGLLIGINGILFAQHHEDSTLDSTSNKKMFGQILNNGKFEFHLRSFYMHTENAPGLLDYSTWGTGAGLGYFSPRWKGFGVGFSGFFVFRHFENNLTQKDPATGLGNRYELTLFDVHHPENHHDMDRLEEFFISYETDKLSAWFGRHHFESPLLNASDNRMRPNLFSGISGSYQPGQVRFTGAWFTHLISRGSLEWVPVEESLGFYSTGRNPLWVNDTYKHQVHSKGIGVLGVEWKQEGIDAQSWTYLAEGIFATIFGELTGSVKMEKSRRVLYGIQGFYQTSLGNGGNPDPAKAYLLPDENTHGLGLKTGVHMGHSELTMNFLYIADQGRFLFPREWGREKFFVSMPRERFEGMGGVHAFGINYDKTFIHDKLKISLGASHVQTPDMENPVLNKYGLPNYLHFTGLIDYRFDGYFKGLDLQFLLAHKNEDRAGKIPLEYVINKVNMTNLNIILDYRF